MNAHERLSKSTELTLAFSVSTALSSGCATKKHAVAQAEKHVKNRPSFAKTRAIAEGGLFTACRW